MDFDPRSPRYDIVPASAAIDELFSLLKSEDISTTIEDALRSGSLTMEQGVATLQIAVWSGSENGASLMRSLERWLSEANDPLRVALALDQEAYPFISREEMSRALRRIALTYPQFADRCRYLIESRARLHE